MRKVRWSEVAYALARRAGTTASEVKLNLVSMVQLPSSQSCPVLDGLHSNL